MQSSVVIADVRSLNKKKIKKNIDGNAGTIVVSC